MLIVRLKTVFLLACALAIAVSIVMPYQCTFLKDKKPAEYMAVK